MRGPHERRRDGTISTQTLARSVTFEQVQRLAQAHLDGLASGAEHAVLREHEDDWVTALEHLLRDVEATIQRLERNVTGPERALVLSDFAAERQRIDDMLAELTGQVAQPGTPELQLSWQRGRIVAWSAGQNADAEATEIVLERLGAAGAATGTWEPHAPVNLPGGTRAPAVSAPVQTTLGWLVSLGASPEEDQFGPSVTWMGLAAALAVRLVTRGRMVPQLQKVGDAPGNRSYFAVRWEPTLIDSSELADLARSMPGAVGTLERQRDAGAIARAVVGSFVDAICRDAARRVEVPSPPPQPRSASDVAEAVLWRLDGSTFEAPHQQGTEIGKDLRSWADAVTGAPKVTLALQLDPPDEGAAWHLRTLTSDGRRQDEPVEAAMSRAHHEHKEALKRELERLETLYAPLMRGKGTRRGQVILSQDEAWNLMTTAGPVLVAAGFDVRVPPLSRKKATPSLRITSTDGHETAVGAQQLTAVRWSAVFDDVELTAEDITRLASESQPLVRSRGRWVAVDHADLEAAAAALADRADRTRLSGAEMLRYALGLDGSALGRPVSVTGEGWAADLLRSAREIPEQPPTSPPGFSGKLRGYQAEALAWLDFLDGAGLGGCLALDMGLGKTPTVLAHLQRTLEHGPALVVAPSAVVGNWAAEAGRFVPGLRVVIHHGADRADTTRIADEAAAADVLITTYGTAVRDIDALADVGWGTVVLDEAQVIKNPLSVTAQQLRRLKARTRVALTGTPIENGLGDMWALMDFVNPGLVGDRSTFIAQMQKASDNGAESALRMLNGVLVFRRTKAEPVIAAELPDRIDKLAHCPMTAEQIGLYQAVLDNLVTKTASDDSATKRKGDVLAAITALKQICNHPEAYTDAGAPLDGRSGKLARLEEIVDDVFEADERLLIFTHFAQWGEKLATHLTARTGVEIACYHGGLPRAARDEMVRHFQAGEGAGALVLSLKAGGTGLNLTAASHVVLYDRWWNPAVEDQARDRAWRIGQSRTVIAHRLVCPGTVDERVEEIVAGKRRIADLALPKSSSVGDLDSDQLRRALGIDPDAVLTDEYGEYETARGGIA
jgi:superfamily II DNA or RNA helicase